MPTADGATAPLTVPMMQATGQDASVAVVAAAAAPAGPDTDALRHMHAKLESETAEHRKRLDAIPPTVTMDLTVRSLTHTHAGLASCRPRTLTARIAWNADGGGRGCVCRASWAS